VAFPQKYRPASLYGGTWTALYEDEGVFFRTGGSQAAAATRTAGLQGHATLNATGYFNTLCIGDGGGNPSIIASSGIMATGYVGYAVNVCLALIVSPSNVDPVYATTLDLSRQSGYKTDTEIRPKNRLIIVWRRTV
jgi:hypothetical protein